jgi:hypothetical protein
LGHDFPSVVAFEKLRNLRDEDFEDLILLLLVFPERRRKIISALAEDLPRIEGSASDDR